MTVTAKIFRAADLCAVGSAKAQRFEHPDI